MLGLVKGCAIEIMVTFSVNLSSFEKEEISGCHSNNYVKTAISFLLFSGKIRYFGGQTVEVGWAAFTKLFKRRQRIF